MNTTRRENQIKYKQWRDTYEKKSFELYVKIFTENNPQVLKSIADYQNQTDESCEIEERNRDYTEEMEENNDDSIDYSFNYETSEK